MNKRVGTLGGAALFFMAFASPSSTNAMEVREGNVLNTIYSMISNERTKLRKCREAKLKDGTSYNLCSIAQQANINGVNFRFFASSPRITVTSFFKERVLVKGGLNISFDYGDSPCVYNFFYAPYIGDSFDDSRIPYRINSNTEEMKKEMIFYEESQKCKKNLMKGKIFDISKIRKIHKKALEDIAFTIRKNTSHSLVSEK